MTAQLRRELKNCIIAARSYEAGVATGPPYGKAIKAVLVCRQSLDGALRELDIQRRAVRRGEKNQ